MPLKLTLRTISAISLALSHLPLAFGNSCDFSKRANTTKTEAETWGGITPTKDLVWHPCYAQVGTFECARFQVPLDYSDPDGRDAAIALIRKPATAKEGYRGPILFNPGGPGGSGVDVILALGDAFATILGSQFDIVSFDPRGIARSTPRSNHFDTDVERTLFAANTGLLPLVKDGVVTGIERIWAQSQLLGSLAASHDDGYLQHITTQNTATDMLRIVEAHGEEKIKFWGFSYGSVLGATFAALYPDKIERMVIDGVVDSPDYYATLWRTALIDSDKTLQLFFDNCAEAGPTQCPFYAPDPADIRRNLTALQNSLLVEPVIVKTDTFYGVVDYSIFSLQLLGALYSPFATFKPLAQALADLAAGNGTGLFSLSAEPVMYQCDCDEDAHAWASLTDGLPTVACNDGVEVSSSLQELQEFWNDLATVSPFADFFGTIRARCTNWPKNKKPFQGPFVGNTSHPLLLVSTTADPVTPLVSAQKMAAGFNGAVVLAIDTGGHASVNAPSICAQQHIRAYFQDGVLPEDGTVCDPIVRNPFLAPASATEGGAGGIGLVGRQDEDAKLLAAVKEVAGKAGSVFRAPSARRRGL